MNNEEQKVEDVVVNEGDTAAPEAPVETPSEETPAAPAPEEAPAEPLVGEEAVFFEGHRVIEKGEEKVVGESMFFSCRCDDGQIYDVPASYFA